MTEVIASRDNERVKRACKLRDSGARRAAEGRFLAEGLRLCTDLAQRLPPEEVYCTQKLSDTKAPQGLFCVFPRRTKTLEAVRGGGRYVCLEHIQDPANVGALLRSAAAFGFAGAVLCGNCADPFSPKAARASMGTLAKVDIIFADETGQALAAFKACGIPSFAAALQNSVPLERVDTQRLPGAALLIGNEGNGLLPGTEAAADKAVRIPMAAGVESLNAAVAGGVLLWHFREV